MIISLLMMKSAGKNGRMAENNEYWRSLDHSIVFLLPPLLVHLLDQLELVVVLRPLLLELLLLTLPLLLLLIPHLLPMKFLQFLLQPCIQLGDVQPFMAINVAVHLGLIEGLIQCDLLFALGLHFHLLGVALTNPSSTSEFLRYGVLG